LFEVNQAAAIIKETAHPDVNLIFGAVIDPHMGDELRITVIATGFERSGVPRRLLEKPSSRLEVTPNTIMEEAPIQVSSSKSIEFQPRTFNTDDLDIPTFLRNRAR
jgi:cell division protein FtsZ